MKKIAVILSGAGYLDGAEITETVSVLIELGRAGVEYDIFAPDKNFNAVAHHSQTQIDLGTRNAIEESARITRGQVKNLNELSVNRYDGVALPGGYGVAKNLSTWAQDGAGCTVNKDFKQILTDFHEQSKPILALCIAPAVVARVLGQVTSPHLTIGNDQSTAKEIEKCGAEHVECSVTDFVTDRENKIVSSPAYMFEEAHHKVFAGIQKACKEFLEMC
jgi:enhancing lycopene biosynthesis protein 2